MRLLISTVTVACLALPSIAQELTFNQMNPFAAPAGGNQALFLDELGALRRSATFGRWFFLSSRDIFHFGFSLEGVLQTLSKTVYLGFQKTLSKNRDLEN